MNNKNKLESPYDLLDDYYNGLVWYKKIITKIRWSLEDIYVKFLCIYYNHKNKKEI